jgi:hypothetical protein
MTENPHPECPICRLVYAVQGQPIDIALRCLKLAERHRCICWDKRHKVLYAHPHTQEGCKGFRSTSGVEIGLAATKAAEPLSP